MKTLTSVIGFFLATYSLFFLYAMYLYIKGKSHERNCTVAVTATVTEMKEERSLSKNGPPNIFYRPVYTYQLSGKEISVTEKEKESKPAYQIGDRVEMKVDPQNPKRYLIEGQTLDNVKTMLTAGIWGGLIIAGIAAFALML